MACQWLSDCQYRVIAVSLVVLVLEGGDENTTGRSRAAVERQPAVIEQAVGSGPHRWVGRNGEGVQTAEPFTYADVSCGYPGSSVLFQVSPPSSVV